MKYVFLVCYFIMTMVHASAASSEILPGLTLAGTGEVRYLGFIRVYEARLYVPASLNREEVLSPLHSKCLKLSYDVDIKDSDIIRAADAILEQQHNPKTIDHFSGELNRLHQSYSDVSDGDSYTLCYDADSSETRLLYNTRLVVSIKSADFAQFYLGIWLNERHPLDDRLRDRLLVGIEVE